MSGLSKASQRYNNLSSVKDNLIGIANMLEANRKKKEQQEFYSNFANLYDKWQQGQQKADEDVELNKGGQVNNVFSPENFTGMSGRKPSGLNLKVNIPENVQEGMIPTAPQTQTREISQGEQYQKGQKNLEEFINGIAPSLMNPNIDDNTLSRGNLFLSLAERQAEKLRPKDPTYFNLNQGDKRFMQDEKGVREVANNPKDKSSENIYERVETFDVNGKPVKRGLRKDTGEWEDIGKAYYKPNITNINMPPEYGKLLGEVNEGIKTVEAIKNKWESDGGFYYPSPDSKYYKTDNDGNTVGYSEKEYKAIKEEEKAKPLAASIQLLNEQGLDNAVEILRGGIEKGKTFKEVIGEFKKANPDFNKEDERILRDYFHLMAL